MIAFLFAPNPLAILTDLVESLMFVLADCILVRYLFLCISSAVLFYFFYTQVWRVHVLWDHSWKVSILPCLLLIINLGSSQIFRYTASSLNGIDTVSSLYYTVYAPALASSQDVRTAVAIGMDDLRYSSILATTILCTALIIFRIVRMGGTRFWCSAQVVIDSALIYVIVLAIFLPYVISPDIVWSLPVYVLQGILSPISVRSCVCVDL
jgi:hypothetical protein